MTDKQILLIEDNADDRDLTIRALKKSNVPNPVAVARDGDEALTMLLGNGRGGQSLPVLILLDLNMPKKDGRTALSEIKGDPSLRHIPVVILTTSKADEDIYRSYDLGVNSYIVKPVTFEALVDILQTLEKYWFEIVELPDGR